MRTKCFCQVAVLTSALASTVAHADEVAPLVPVLDPPKAAELIVRFHEALASGLKAGGMPVMDPAAVRERLKLPPENAGCAAGACLTTAVGALGARRFGTAKISTVGKNYQIEVRLFRGTRELTKAESRCDICTLTEALAATTRVATEVGSRGEEPPVGAAKAAPKETPPAAVEPPTRSAPVPPMTTTASNTIGGNAATASEPGAAAGSAVDATPRRWPLWPVIAAGGAGAVSLAVGIPLLVLDGGYTQCVGAPRADGRNCAEVYDTNAAGGVLTAMGVAGLGASGVLLYLHLSSRGSEDSAATPGIKTVSIGPADGGMMFGAGGTF